MLSVYVCPLFGAHQKTKNTKICRAKKLKETKRNERYRLNLNGLTLVVTAIATVTGRGTTDVFLWICFEGFFASWSAEIVVFALVDCFVFCSFFIHIHVAYQIFSHTFSPPLNCLFL